MRAVILGVFLMALSGGAGAETVRIATWNMNNLHFETGEPLRNRAPARSDGDFALLREYRDRMDADIIAFQEVNGPKAAHRVFPEDDYEVIVSGRYRDDQDTGRGSDRIYTGFAIKRDSVTLVDTSSVADLGLADRGKSIRHGTEILIEKNGKRVRLMSVHLKSGCFTQSLTNPRSNACETLAEQLDPLEDWIDEQAEGDVPFIIAGDFNRALDVHGRRDHLWQEIDDGAPSGLKLWRLPFSRESQCLIGTRAHHEDPIDFFVFDDRAWALVDRDSFQQVDYDASDRDLAAGTPSDHCPITVDLRI